MVHSGLLIQDMQCLFMRIDGIDNEIASTALGFVERAVRSLNEGICMPVCVGNQCRAAHAHGDNVVLASGMVDSQAGHGLPQLLRQIKCVPTVRVRQYNGEFLTAETGDRVSGAPENLTRGIGDLAQAVIAAKVPVEVVVKLEVVHIKQQQRDWRTRAAGAPPLML